MNTTRLQTIGTAVTALLGVLIVLAGFGMGLTFLEETDEAWYIAFGLATILAGALILGGLFMIKSPWPAAGTLSSGALLLPLLWNWIWPITVPVMLVVVAFAVFRARELTREPG